MSKTNYNKMHYNKPAEVEKPVEVEQPVEETVEEVVTETEQPVEETVTKPEPKMGVVTECMKLNVREEPNADANIVCTINLATEVEIDEANSTEDFYKIYTASGIEGFCMKKFIAV